MFSLNQNQLELLQMQQSLDIMQVSLRLLAALNAKEAPDQVDVETLRKYLGCPGPPNLDELTCEVIQKALLARAKARAAIEASGVS